MKKYKLTVHYRYVGDGQLEKDHDTFEINAVNEGLAKDIVSSKYGSKCSIFLIECAEIMTKEKMFNLTNPLNVTKI